MIRRRNHPRAHGPYANGPYANRSHADGPYVNDPYATAEPAQGVRREGKPRESVWRRAVDAAAYAANERVRFHPLWALLWVGIGWGFVVAMEGLDTSLTYLMWAVLLIYPILGLVWAICFIAVLVVALVLLPFGDGVDGMIDRRRRRRASRRT